MKNLSKLMVCVLLAATFSVIAYAQNNQIQKLNDEAQKAIIGTWIVPYNSSNETTIIITEDEFIYIPDPDRSKRVSNWLNPRTRKSEEFYSSSELFENDDINVVGYTVENVKDLSTGRRDRSYELKGNLKLSDGRLLPFGVNVFDPKNPAKDRLALGTRKSDGTFEQNNSFNYSFGINSFERENARESRYKEFEDQVKKIRDSNFYKGSGKATAETPKASE